MSLADCAKQIRDAAGQGLTDREVMDLMDEVQRRADRVRRQRPDLAEADAISQATTEATQAALAQKAIEARNRKLNLQKRIARRRFYDAAPDPATGLEARLVGVNTVFAGSRRSVAAEGRALERDFLGGMVTELQRAGLLRTVRNGKHDRAIAAEMAELNKPAGKPGISGDRAAERAAVILRKYQEAARQTQNDAGAWIGQLEDWIARTAHNQDAIRRAGYDQWRAFVLARLDHERTFADQGIEDVEAFLRSAWEGLSSGIHLTMDGAQGLKDPAFSGPANLAKKLSKSRQLHWKDSEAWMDYLQAFGQKTLIGAVTDGLRHAARNAALMRSFGTNPRAELENDIRALEQQHRATPHGQRLAGMRRTLGYQMDELDGTTQRPEHALGAKISASVRAIQSMAKLGGAVISAISDVAYKAGELRYQGVNPVTQWTDSLVSLVRGRGWSDEETREIMDLLKAGLDGMIGDIAARFDATTDDLPGVLSKLQNLYFKLNGLQYWTDAQRAGAEFIMAAELGRHHGTAWDDLPAETRRILTVFDITADAWSALSAADWHQTQDGRTWLTPDAATRIGDDAIDAMLGERADALADQPDALATLRDRTRQELAMKLHGYFADRGEYAVLNPGARERALMRRGTQPGTHVGEALRFIMQFKAFPITVISKAWGRETYGRAGIEQGAVGPIAGVIHMMVAATIFGVVAATLKDLAKGRNPRDPTDPSTVLAGFIQGGGAGIYGDFFLGYYNRFGGTALETFAGPTLGSLTDLVNAWNGFRTGQDVSAETFRWAVNNTPFLNLFYVRPVLDWLFLWQWTEALSPGWARRFERRVKEQNNQTFWLRPTEAVR